jgi:hypothetical protein
MGVHRLALGVEREVGRRLLDRLAVRRERDVGRQIRGQALLVRDRGLGSTLLDGLLGLGLVGDLRRGRGRLRGSLGNGRGLGRASWTGGSVGGS